MGWFEYEEQLTRPWFFCIDKWHISGEYDNMSGTGEEQKMFTVFSHPTAIWHQTKLKIKLSHIQN